MKCPLADCSYNGRNESGLWQHLMMDHRKDEVVKALLLAVKVAQAFRELAADQTS